MAAQPHDWVSTSDGVRLAVDRLAPEGPAGAAVVVVHGFSGHRHQPEVVALRDVLAADGFCVYTYDSRGHGQSEGVCTLGDLERHDVEAVAARARGDHPQVVVVGASMGAIASLRYAAGTADPLTGVIAVSSPARWRLPVTPRGIFSTLLTQTGPGRALLARQGIRVAAEWTRPEPPVDLVQRIDVPVAFIHGHRDRWIHPMASLQLHRLARDERRLELVAGMGHAFDPLGIPAIRAAVAWALRTAGRTGAA